MYTNSQIIFFLAAGLAQFTNQPEILTTLHRYHHSHQEEVLYLKDAIYPITGLA